MTMPLHLGRSLGYAVAAVVALGMCDPAAAKTKKAPPQQPDIMQDEAPPPKQPKRPRPRGSSTYIPPPNPSPYAGPPAAGALAPGPGVYHPPPIRSFGDRAIDAQHSFPLERGIGNNPTDLQMYIRQRANQP